MHHACRRLGWGEHRGGMFVTVEGTRPDGARLERFWHMIAEGDDGPFIPSMAAEAVGAPLPAPGGRRRPVHAQASPTSSLPTTS